MRPSRRSPTALLVALLPVLLVLGIWLGGHPDRLPGFARETLVADSEGRLYEEALDIIAEDYYRPVDRGRLVDRSIDEAVRSLRDQFSAYFSPEEYADFRAATTGEFEGVGMNVEQVPEGLRVLTVFEGSPARREGLRPGDVITAVDGRSIRGRSSQEATALIKGEAGTSVILTVRRGE